MLDGRPKRSYHNVIVLLPEFSPSQLGLLLISVPLLIGGLWMLTRQSERPRDFHREKRRAKRIKNTAVFDLEDGKGNFSPGNAQLIDISAWGACISTTVSLAMGQQIRGRVRSAEGLLRVSGRVVWTKPKAGAAQYGIAFENVTRL